MWCTGAYVACSALNAFVSLLLRTQDPGSDNTLRLTGAALALHTFGVLQVFVPSASFAYLQWACSAPLLCWLLVQLLSTMPPGSGTPSAARLFRVAVVEIVLALLGLALLLTLDMPLVRGAASVVSVTVLLLELLPVVAPTILSHLAAATGASGGGGGGTSGWLAAYLVNVGSSSRNRSNSGSGNGSNSGSGNGSNSGSGWSSRYGPLAPRTTGSGGGGGAGGSGALRMGGSGSYFTGLPSGVAGQSLPVPMEALLCVVVGGKLVQAITAAALGTVSPGIGLTPPTGDAAVAPILLWSLSTSITLFGLPLAVCMYYGLLRYAASMLVGWRSTLRRVSSLGMSGAGMVGLPSAGSSGAEDGTLGGWLQGSRTSLVRELLPSLRRAPTYSGADSDSDSGFPAAPSRLLDIGELYRITESSGYSVSNSTNGDESCRNDLALTQLLYMARTTFRRSSSEEVRTAAAGLTSVDAAVSGGVGHMGGTGGSSGTTSSQLQSPILRSYSQSMQTATKSIQVQTENRVSFGSRRSDMAVQCNIGPSTVIKEVPVEVPAAAGAGGGGEGGSLMALLQALRESSSDIAHDMKNPLNGVLALSQNVLQGTFGELPPPAADQLGVVRSCAYHLLNMINQLRDCLRMLHGGEPDGSFGRVQLSNPIEEVLKRMSPMVGTRLSIRADHDPSLIVFADDGRLYQTIHTVLANAFKYTRKGGVTIETSTSADKTAVTLLISDTGNGFTAEQLDKFNSALTGSPHEQLGLGLTLVKRTMAYFGGVLRLSNRTGGGSGACVELTFRSKEEVPRLGASLPPPPKALATAAAPSPPVAASAPPPPVVPREPYKKLRKSTMGGGGGDRAAMEERLVAANSSNGGGHGPSSVTTPSVRGGGGGSTAQTGGLNDEALTGKDELVRVLIVDDDPVNLTILEDLLRAEGYDLLTAASGTEALEVYLTSDPQPKLVLLDVTLPDMSGHEVCLKMRSLTPGVPPPIIMISGKASTKDVIKGLQAGACDYITKPFQPQEVLARVETQLRMFMGEVAQLQEEAERNMALLRQILPPHVLASLRGGTRVLVEKFSDVVVLCADVVGFSALAAAADTADCILTLNRLFSTFDAITDKMGVHKMDCHTDSYVAALGHRPQDRHISHVMQVKQMLDLAREMLAAVDTLPYPDTLGKMQIRIGMHVGAVFGGVIGIKYPRYSLFGSTLRLAQGLQATALPNTIHVTEVVHNRVRAAGGESFMPYTTSQVQSLGIIRTFLVAGGPNGTASPGMLDYSHMDSSIVLEYLRTATAAAHGITVLNCLLGAAAGGAAAVGMGLGTGITGLPGMGMGMGLGDRPALLRLAPVMSAAPLAKIPAEVDGAGGGGGGGAEHTIIPVIPDQHRGDGSVGSNEAGGIGEAGSGQHVVAVGGGGGSMSRDSYASGYAISLAQVSNVGLDTGGTELMSTLAAVTSGDAGSLVSEVGPAAISFPTPPTSASALHGHGGTAAVGHMSASITNNAGPAATAAAGSSSHGSRRHMNDASLVQDLMPGPYGAGLTRLQRLHAGPQQSGSGAVSPWPLGSCSGGTGSRDGSGGSSRNASFRLGASGASPLAATLMHQHVLSSLQQQQQLHQEAAAGDPQADGGVMISTMRSTENSIGFVAELDENGKSQSTSEPLIKLDPVVVGGGGGEGPVSVASISSAAMRRIHVPLKAASIGALPGALGRAGGNGSAVAGIRGGMGPTAGVSISASATGISAGSLTSSLSLSSPLRTPYLAHGSSTSAVATAPASIASSFNVIGQSSPYVIGQSSPYAGLSSETRARLARLRTSSQPDLMEASTALSAAASGAAYTAAATADNMTSVLPVSVEKLYVSGPPAAGVYGTAGGGGIHCHQSVSGFPQVHPSTAHQHPPTFSPVRYSAGPVHSSLQPIVRHSSTPPSPLLQQQQQQQHLQQTQQQRPSSVCELLESLGLGHYYRSISGAVAGGLDELASLDDGGLRKVGLVSSRSRQLVREELMRLGYK